MSSVDFPLAPSAVRSLGRRRIGAAIAGALLLLAIAGGGAFTFAPGVSVAMQEATSQLGDFLARSPGERSDADILKGKKGGKGSAVATQLADAKPRDEEVLSNAITPVEDDLASTAPIVEGDEPVLALSDLEDTSTGDLASAPLLQTIPGRSPVPGLTSGGLFPVGIGGGGSGGGGGGGGGGGTPPPVAAVPEPDTWIMMLIGMAMCGAALRRRKRAVRMGLV